MIKRSQISLNSLKKETHFSSYMGMRFAIFKNEEMLDAYIYPEPYNFEVSKAKYPESVINKSFEFSNDGLNTLIEWLNEQYNLHVDYWTARADISIVYKI